MSLSQAWSRRIAAWTDQAAKRSESSRAAYSAAATEGSPILRDGDGRLVLPERPHPRSSPQPGGERRRRIPVAPDAGRARRLEPDPRGGVGERRDDRARRLRAADRIERPDRVDPAGLGPAGPQPRDQVRDRGRPQAGQLPLRLPPDRQAADGRAAARRDVRSRPEGAIRAGRTRVRGRCSGGR